MYPARLPSGGVSFKEGLRIDSRKLALRIARAVKDKKALNTCVLDMRGVCNFCDYFVLASAGSLRHVNALAEAIQENLAKDKEKPLSNIPANDESGWIVLDYSSVVVHLFHKPMRAFYDLEHLWADAKRVRITAKDRM